MPPISLVLLHHNKAPYSRACLQSLLSTSALGLQIVNVDNGSRDETPQILDEFEGLAAQKNFQTTRLTFDSNIGAIRGRNEALKICTGEFLGFLDNDILVSNSEWLRTLSSFLIRNPKCGIVAPQLLFPWSPFQIECAGVGVSKIGRIQYIGRGQDSGTFPAPFPVQCAISAAWLMRREVVEKIGDLDEIYSPVQFEDLDFCYRARAAGFEVWMEPRAHLFHFEHTTTAGSDDINFRYVTTKNGLTFKKRWSETFALENGPSDEACRWQEIPKLAIDEVDWERLLPQID